MESQPFPSIPPKDPMSQSAHDSFARPAQHQSAGDEAEGLGGGTWRYAGSCDFRGKQ